MTTIAGTLLRLLEIHWLALVLGALTTYALHIHLGGTTVAPIHLKPKKPTRPHWLRQYDAMTRRLRERAAAEWARLRTDRRGGPRG